MRMDTPANDTGDLVAARPPLLEIDLRRWPDFRLAAFEYLSPAALCLVASDGPVSITLWGRSGAIKRLGHNRGIWPAKLAKTAQIRDAVTTTYDKGLFFIGTQFRVWCLDKAERDRLSDSVLDLIAQRSAADGGMDTLPHGFQDLGPDIDFDFFEMEVHTLADRIGVTHWDDDALVGFLDRVALRVERRKAARVTARLYEEAALQELGRA